MLETIKAAFLNLYKINNIIIFLIISFILLPDTITKFIRFVLDYLPMNNNVWTTFLYSYIVIQVMFFIVELLNNFILIPEDTKQVISNLSQLSQYIYIFICFINRKLILPPFENNLILFVYILSLVAIGNQLCLNLKTIGKNIRQYPKIQILFIFSILILLYFTKTIDLKVLLNQLHLSNWIAPLKLWP